MGGRKVQLYVISFVIVEKKKRSINFHLKLRLIAHLQLNSGGMKRIQKGQ